MPRFKGRSASACYYCHSQKVKCSGGKPLPCNNSLILTSRIGYPCVKCRASSRECLFPSRSRALTVPEDYLRGLQSEVAQLRQSLSNATAASARGQSRGSIGDQQTQSPGDTSRERLIEDSTTEHFIRKLKGIQNAPASTRSAEYSNQATPHTHWSGESVENEKSTTPSYTYVPLDYDNTGKSLNLLKHGTLVAHTPQETRVFVKLPPHSYALYLLGQFESFIGSDYHWYRKQRFRDKMEAAYHTSQPQSMDRTWLCCFSVALALGESYNDSTSPSFLLQDNIGVNHDGQLGDESQGVAPPGIELFKQGLLLLKPSYEQPTIEQVEALNLIVS